jgi:Trk K+ transport system NAD-binding subunit
MSAITDKILSTSKLKATNGEYPAGDRAECYVLGGGDLGVAVAHRLRAEGVPVTLVDETHDPTTGPGVRGDPSDLDLLTESGLADASAVVVATPDDRRNLLVAQLVRARFSPGDVFVLVHEPALCDVVADAGHRAICVTSALSDAVAADLTGRRRDATSG